MGLEAKAMHGARRSRARRRRDRGRRRAAASSPTPQHGFILDGFPRTAGQADALDALLAKLGTPLERCVALQVDDDELVKRLSSRAEIEGRSDDNETTIRNRMNVYREQTQPLIDHYRKQGVLAEVAGDGSIDEVAARIEEARVVMAFGEAIRVKTRRETDAMREAARHVAEVLLELRELAKPGVTTAELDQHARRAIRKRGVVSSFLGYGPHGLPPYPAVLCVSVNEEVVHGIPGSRDARRRRRRRAWTSGRRARATTATRPSPSRSAPWRPQSRSW